MVADTRRMAEVIRRMAEAVLHHRLAVDIRHRHVLRRMEHIRHRRRAPHQRMAAVLPLPR